jgi:hypothetical protein
MSDQDVPPSFLRDLLARVADSRWCPLLRIAYPQAVPALAGAAQAAGSCACRTVGGR